MNNDPISQLPEPYRAAWDILHESLGYYQMLERVLITAQKMVGATWGMMILATDLNGLDPTLSGFRTLPDMYNTTIPIGHISSMAYVLARRVIDDGQSILISDTDSVIPSYEEQLMNNYLPPSTREMILRRAEEEWFASRLLEIPSISRITALAVPIIDKDKVIGSVYLHRQVSEGGFNEEEFHKVEIFLTCVAIGIKNTKEASDIKHSGFRILAIGSSELRTPLTLIAGYAKLLREQPQMMQEKIGLEKIFTTIENNANRVMLVLDDLLDYARIEQGYVYKQGINLKDVFNPILDKYQSLVKEKNQTLILDLPDSLNVEIEAEHFLSPLIEMCVQGAHHYTPDGGEIRISISLSQDAFQFQVMDSGTSLTEDEQSHFFEQYYHTKWQDAARGSGLNLYVAKRVVELWGGQISIKSLSERGNTLWFKIPVKKNKNQERE